MSNLVDVINKDYLTTTSSTNVAAVEEVLETLEWESVRVLD